MENNIALEWKVIEKFIQKDKRDRYKQFVAKEKTRPKFIRDLAHFKYLEIEKFDRIEGGGEELRILERLKKSKIDTSTCYIISQNSRLDTKTLETIAALKDTIGLGMGTIFVFGDADIIYFEGEEAFDRLISK